MHRKIDRHATKIANQIRNQLDRKIKKNRLLQSIICDTLTHKVSIILYTPFKHIVIRVQKKLAFYRGIYPIFIIS